MANEQDRPGQGPAADEIRQRMEREAEAARQTAQHLGENVQHQAKDIASGLQDEAQRMFSEQKETAKSSMMDVVSAIRRAADDLEARQQPQVANMARSIAGGIEDFSQSIGKRNFNEMLSDVQRFARDHPTVFFGGALVAGLAIARFAKSSGQHAQTSQQPASQQPAQTGTPYDAQRASQTGQLSEFARSEREQGMPPGMTR